MDLAAGLADAVEEADEFGAALGGAVINAGLGYPAISLAGAAMAGLGLLMVLAFAWRSRSTAAAVA